jgi:hypothetical protein
LRVRLPVLASCPSNNPALSGTGSATANGTITINGYTNLNNTVIGSLASSGTTTAGQIQWASSVNLPTMLAQIPVTGIGSVAGVIRINSAPNTPANPVSYLNAPAIDAGTT